MENYLFVLLLSVFVLIVAFYVEQRILQIKDELLQHESKTKTILELCLILDRRFMEQMSIQDVHKEEIYQIEEVVKALHEELKEIKEELLEHGFRSETQQLIEESELTSIEIFKHYVTEKFDYTHRRFMDQMSEQYVHKKDQIGAVVNVLREELNEIKRGSSKEDHDLQDQLLEKGEKEKELGNDDGTLEDLVRIAMASPHSGPTDHRKPPIVVDTTHTKPVFGKHYWRVSEKVPGYGADLTLFCFVDDCCIRSAGWIKWNPDYKTIYLDVRNFKGTVSSKDKYATTNNKTGFSLVIKHLQEDDLNIIYSCSYGFKNSIGKLLHHSEVFKVDETTTTHFADETTTTHFADETTTTNFKIETSISHFKEVTDETATTLNNNSYYSESENNSKSVKIICIVGAVVAVLAIIFIVKFYQRRRLASRNRRKSSEEGQVAQNQLLEKRKEEESANGTTKLGECLNSDDSEDCKSIPYSESSC